MPSQTFSGKSKDDLVIVARLSGLLAEEEAQSMSRAALARFLEQAQNATEESAGPVTDAGAAESASGAEPEKPTRRRVGRPRKAAVPSASQKENSAEITAGDTAESAVQTAPKTRRKTTTKAAAKTEVAAAEEGEAAKAAASEAAAPKTKAKPGPKPGSRTTTAKAGAKTAAAGKSRAKKPAPVAAVNEASPAEEPVPINDAVVQVVAAPAEDAAKTEETTPEAKATSEIEAAPEAKAEPAAETAPEAKTTPEAETAPEAEAAPAEAAKPTRAPRRGRPPKNRTLSGVAAPGTLNIPSIPETAVSTPVSSDESQVQTASVEKAETTTAPVSVVEPAETTAEPEAAAAAADAAGTAVHTPRHPGQSPHAPVSRKQDSEPGRTEPGKVRRPYVETGELVSGVLEIMPDGYGFLRKDNYLQGSKDIYVPPQYIRRFNLREGDLVVGPGKVQRDSDRYQALLYIKEVNGLPPERMIRRPHFDKLTPIYPNERFVLETTRNELSTRIIDLVAPIGKGQRGMIVSPPKAGKTILLQKIANAISINNPDAKLIVLLIDERPEEVTDMQRSIKGEVVYSTFDKTPENHVKVTELVLERAMRLVELNQDVVILLDSITRMGRAYNLTINPTGRTLSGGLDPGALYGPKRFFGAARNIEGGGSLTIVATALIDTGSRMDEVIFEEFKGTGNMEVYLDRKLSEKRIFPAIDINRSGTRREELLLGSKELDAVWSIRKAFGQLDTAAVTEMIISLLMKTNNNQHFVSSINVSLNDKNIFEAMRGNRPSQSNQSQNGYSG